MQFPPFNLNSITLILSDFKRSEKLYRRIQVLIKYAQIKKLKVSFDTICSLHSQITQDERK